MDTRLDIATKKIIDKVHAYMQLHPESELHKCGKMFGVLVYNGEMINGENGVNYLAAFSAKLDSSYFHEGFVPPVYEMTTPPVGTSKAESQRLQRLLFANYNFVNGKGETKNLLEIFKDEKPIIPADEWFNKSEIINLQYPISNLQSPMPPSGAGECCAPKLLQYALTHGLKPIQLAEFWVGAPSKTEIRQEGQYYAPCSGRCVPILKHMTQGLEDLRIEGVQKSCLEGAKKDFKVENLPKPEILFEDDYLIVVNKSAGLLSVPGKSDEPSAESLLHARAVHRLDKDTSGLLVLAKTPEVYKTLQAYFQRHDIFKRYEAILCPNQKSKILNLKSEGQIDLPLLPNPYDRPRQMVSLEHGKPAITRYHIREHRPDGTLLVDFYPLTGRTHQLRVHAAHPEGLNAPIVGDRLYNGDASLNGGLLNDEGRLMLHAAEIRFVHPITKKEMHFCIPFL